MSDIVISADSESYVEGRLTGLSAIDWLLTLWSGRGLLSALVRRDIEMRYRGSVFGVAWLVLSPILLTAVYTYTSGVVFGSRFPGGGIVDSALSIYIGVILFFMFSEPLVRSFVLIHEMAPFVKKVAMPVRVLPAIAAGTAVLTATVSFAILLAALAVSGRMPGPTHVAVFVLLLAPFVMAVLGTCWFAAAAGAYVRDLKHVASFAVMGLLFLSPIFYPMSAAPGPMRTLAALNPIAFIIEAARGLLLAGRMPDAGSTAVFVGLAFALCASGYAVFRRVQRGFADVV